MKKKTSNDLIFFFCENCHELFHEGIENIMQKIRFVDDTQFFQCACSTCNEKHLYPMDKVNKALRDREKRLKYGLDLQENFKEFWKLKYARKYGSLIETDINPYDSEPDYFNPKLKVHFEVKTKWQTWDFIVTKGDGLVWVNKKSMDYKHKKQLENPNELYVVVFYFPDEGYKVAKVEDIVKSPPKDFELGSVYGSGDSCYMVHVSRFRDFKDFIESLKR